MCAVGDLQFREYVGDVVPYRLGTQGELPGDRGVGVALGDQAQDLAFSAGKGGEGLRRSASLR